MKPSNAPKISIEKWNCMADWISGYADGAIELLARMNAIWMEKETIDLEV